MASDVKIAKNYISEAEIKELERSIDAFFDYKVKTMDKKSAGFTSIELIVVIAILGILSAVVVPRLGGFRSKAEKSVCTINLKTVERMYSAFLVENDIDHEDSIFNQLLDEDFDEICPAGGFISYEDGKVTCSVHRKEEQPPGEESPGEEVPWL